MRVAQHVVDARRRQLAELLQRHRYLGIGDLCKEFGISEATVRRDLAFLEKSHLVTRTYGGALADFNLRFPSFRRRRGLATEGKQHIAEAALSLLRPELTVFFDGGTTIFALAEVMRENPVRPLTCVTSNLPVADVLSEIEGVAVHLLGGELLRRQSVLLGEEACQAAGRWQFDLALLSAEGMTREGLWNSQPAVVALQRAVMARTRCKVALLDRSKLGHTTPQFLCAWENLDGLLTDAPAEVVENLRIPTHMTEMNHIMHILGTLDLNRVPPAGSMKPEPVLESAHELDSEPVELAQGTLPTSLL